jgi:hypothetical protein
MSERLIKIPVSGPLVEVFVEDFGYPALNTVLFDKDTLIEPVRPKGFDLFSTPDTKVIFVVDEEGLLKELPLNTRASLLYGSHVHQQPIVGDAYVLFETFDPMEGGIWTGLPEHITIPEVEQAIAGARFDPSMFQ